MNMGMNKLGTLSPWDATDPFQPRQMGSPALRVAYASGIHAFEAICIPTFESTKLPAIGDRFFIYYPQTVPNPGYPQAGPQELKVHYAGINNSFEPSSGRSRQYAVRYSMSWDGWDTAVSYFSGYEHTAIPEGKVVSLDPATGIADVMVNYIYPKEGAFDMNDRMFASVTVQY